MNRRSNSLILIFLSFFVLPSLGYATPEHAEQTGFECQRCHADPAGGKLTRAGEEFREELKAKGLYRPLHPVQKAVRLIIGYLHLLMAIAWFGTILYVHLLLKPAYAARGLPKGELILGWLGIVILSVTGVLLTTSRVPTLNVLYSTKFGILLSVKISLFLIMVTSAFIVTFLIGPRLRKQKALALPVKKSKLTLEELLLFDGSEGRPAYFAYQGKIYDATSSRLWKEGHHVKRHRAGNDLTELLKTAPHGEENVFRMPVVGELLPVSSKTERPPHEKVFYFMAYMNLIFVFLITFIIALWRWG